MKMRYSAAVVGICLLTSWLATADDEPPRLPRASNAAKNSNVETVVYAVRNGPANQIAETLRELYDDPNMRFLPEPMSNLLLIRVESDRRDEIIKLLGELDQTKNVIVLRAQLLRAKGDALSTEEEASLSGPANQVASQIKRLGEAGRVVVLNRMELAVLEQQRSMLQAGEDIPIVTGTNSSASRGRTNMYQHQSVGTMLSVTARTSPDRQITVEVQFEKSGIEASVSEEDSTDQMPDSVARLTLQTTLQLTSGYAALTGGAVNESTDGSTHSYFVISATIAGTSPDRQAVESRVEREPARAPRSSGSFSTRGSIPRDRIDSLVSSVFIRADKNQDGVLEGDELDVPGGSGDRADANNDGKVTRAEFKQYLLDQMNTNRSNDAPGQERRRSSSETNPTEIDKRYLQYAIALIKKYDADKDGMLDEDELSSANRDYTNADKDRDGKVAPDELVEWMKKR